MCAYMTKEEHDKYIEEIKLQYADAILENDINERMYRPNADTKYYDRQGNIISLGLFLALIKDVNYTFIKKDFLSQCTILTNWEPLPKKPLMFKTRVFDHHKKKLFFITYDSEKKAIEEHEKLLNLRDNYADHFQRKNNKR